MQCSVGQDFTMRGSSYDDDDDFETLVRRKDDKKKDRSPLSPKRMINFDLTLIVQHQARKYKISHHRTNLTEKTFTNARTMGVVNI